MEVHRDLPRTARRGNQRTQRTSLPHDVPLSSGPYGASHIGLITQQGKKRYIEGTSYLPFAIDFCLLPFLRYICDARFLERRLTSFSSFHCAIFSEGRWNCFDRAYLEKRSRHTSFACGQVVRSAPVRKSVIYDFTECPCWILQKILLKVYQSNLLQTLTLTALFKTKLSTLNAFVLDNLPFIPARPLTFRH